MAPYQPKWLKIEKRIMVPTPSSSPTNGKKSNIMFKTSFFDKSSCSLKLMGNIEKYEKENFRPK